MNEEHRDARVSTSSPRNLKRSEISLWIKKTYCLSWRIKRGIVRSLKRKCIVSVSHRCVLEPDDNFVFGGIAGGIVENNTAVNFFMPNAYYKKYGPLLAPSRFPRHIDDHCRAQKSAAIVMHLS